MAMKPKDVAYVYDTVENEGFEYAFVNYTDFKEIEDEEFHRLRNAYLAARRELAEYVGSEE